MPVLTNARHERFAQGIAAGLGTRQAYLQAGYKTSPEAADASGARLLGDAKVRARVVELQSKAAEQTAETVEGITKELNEALRMAREQERPDRMVMAAVAKAKLNGLIVEKSESTVTHKHEDRVRRREEAIARRRQEREHMNGDGSSAH